MVFYIGTFYKTVWNPGTIPLHSHIGNIYEQTMYPCEVHSFFSVLCNVNKATYSLFQMYLKATLTKSIVLFFFVLQV